MKLPAKIEKCYIALVNGHHRQPAEVVNLPEAKCQNCGTEYHGNFCPNCGQSASTKRFTLAQTLKHVLFIFTKFDDTFWHTTFELFTRPGHMIRDYLRGHRVEYLRPLQLLICLITAYLIVVHLCFGENALGHTHLIENVESVDKIMKNETANMVIAMAEKAMNNMLVSTLMSITLLAFCTYWSFRRINEGKTFNFAEHFYAMIYLQSIYLIICFLILPYQYFAGESPSGGLNFWAVLIIMVIVYAQLMRVSWRKSMMLCLLAYCIFALIFIFFCGLITGTYYAIVGAPR